jgi:hypothetical protein
MQKPLLNDFKQFAVFHLKEVDRDSCSGKATEPHNKNGPKAVFH